MIVFLLPEAQSGRAPFASANFFRYAGSNSDGRPIPRCYLDESRRYSGHSATTTRATIMPTETSKNLCSAGMRVVSDYDAILRHRSSTRIVGGTELRPAATVSRIPWRKQVRDRNRTFCYVTIARPTFHDPPTCRCRSRLVEMEIQQRIRALTG